MPGALVYVYNTGTTVLATGLRDISNNPLANPFESEENGLIQFQAPNKTYDVRVVKGARDYTLRGIQCADLTEMLEITASFLGPHATAPTTRNDGTPLELADRYLNTTDDLEYIYKTIGWSPNNLDGQIISGPSGGDYVSLRLNAIGAAVRTANETLVDFVSVLSFGAEGSERLLSDKFETLPEAQEQYPFVTDLTKTVDWAAFSAAAAYGGMISIPGNHTFVLNGDIPADDVYWFGSGSDAEVIFTHGGDGFSFAPKKFSTLSGARDLIVSPRGADGGIAFKTEYDAKHYIDINSRYEFIGLSVSGATQVPGSTNGNQRVESWTTGFQIADCWNTVIDRIDGLGNFKVGLNPAPQLKSVLIRMDAAAAALNVRVSRINNAFWYRTAEIGKRIFHSFNDIDSSVCYDGIVQIYDTDVFSESRFNNLNLNIQRYGLKLANVGSKQATNLTFRQHRTGNKDNTDDWYGLHLTNVNFSQFANIECTIDESDGPFLNRKSYGVYAVNCTGPNIQGFVIGGRIDTGVVFDNCTQAEASGITTNQNKVDAVLIDLRNNTRETVLGTYKKSSGFVGETLKLDTNIQANAITAYQRSVIPENSTPAYWLRKRNAPTDQKNWRHIVDSTTWIFQLASDDELTFTQALRINRTGMVVDSIELRGTNSIFGNAIPNADAVRSLGTSSAKWSTVNAVSANYTGPIRPGQYTLSTLPSASAFNGYEIDVTDATGGPKRCRSNGSVWQILNTTTTVS